MVIFVRIFTIYSTIQCSVVKMQQENQIKRVSNLRTTFGCLRSNNITIFIRDGFPEYIDKNLHLIFKTLDDDPCNTLHYSYTARKIVRWEGEEKHDLRADMFRTLTDSEQREFSNWQNQFVEGALKQLGQQHNEEKGHTRQMLLLFQSVVTEDFGKAIRKLQENADWTVIIICGLICPDYEGIPVNQIVPLPIDNIHRVRDLVRNPSFNIFKLLRYTKSRIAHLTCMSNMTIHYSIDGNPTFNLLEKVAMISASNNESKLVLDQRLMVNNLFWSRFIEYSFRDYGNVLLERDGLAKTVKTNQVFLTNALLLKDVLCRPGTRKHVIFYIAVPFTTDDVEYYKSIQNSCSMEFEKLTIKTGILYPRDLINDVQKASCF